MKKLAWTQIILGILLLVTAGFVIVWSLTSLVDKVEGPAFPNQTDTTRWVHDQPGLLNTARGLVWPIFVFGGVTIFLGVVQLRHPERNRARMAVFQILSGCLAAFIAFIVLLAVHPTQFILTAPDGTRFLGMRDSMWDDAYAVMNFTSIVLGLAIASVGIFQHGRNEKPAARPAPKAGWKSARNPRKPKK